MSVNGITTGTPGYQNYETKAKTTKDTVKEQAQTQTQTVENGAVYEPSKQETVPKTYKPNTEMVNKLMADAEARTAQLRSLVEKLITGQGKAIGSADDMWSFLRSGNFTVDAATKAQAQADIAEDGYWGINQTSDRIVDFAKALTGGDPDKIEEMKEAFIKGFKMATKTWGDELPEISQKTYDAVLEKFDAWKKEATDGDVEVQA